MGPRDRGVRMESRAMGNYGVPLRVRRQRRDPELHKYARGTIDIIIKMREGAAVGAVRCVSIIVGDWMPTGLCICMVFVRITFGRWLPIKNHCEA